MEWWCSNLWQWPLWNLGSVAIFKNLSLALPPHPFQLFLWIIIFNSSILPPPYKKLFIVVALYMCCTLSPPSLLTRSATHIEFFRTRHLSASADCLWAPRHVPMSSAIYRDCAPPPLYHPQTALIYLSSPWVSTRRGYPHIPCAAYLPSLSAPPNPRIFQFLVSLSGGFSREAERPGNLHLLAVARPYLWPPR